jgi:hypothetical protein
VISTALALFQAGEQGSACLGHALTGPHTFAIWRNIALGERIAAILLAATLYLYGLGALF